MTEPELHVISNGKLTLLEFAEIAATMESFVSAFHIREKGSPATELWNGVTCLIERGIPDKKIYLNDGVDVAVAAGAGGVQLAYHSLEPRFVKQAFPRLRVGRSVHSVEEAKDMEQQGADYLLYGHIFPSGSKSGLQARGIGALAEVVRQVTIPVIAIGGILPEHVKTVLGTGAAGIAVMSGILSAAEPAQMAEQYRKEMNGGRTQHGMRI